MNSSTLEGIRGNLRHSHSNSLRVVMLEYEVLIVSASIEETWDWRLPRHLYCLSLSPAAISNFASRSRKLCLLAFTLRDWSSHVMRWINPTPSYKPSSPLLKCGKQQRTKNSLVKHNHWTHSSCVPKRMRVQNAPNRWEIKNFQAHSTQHPQYNRHRPEPPHKSCVPVLINRKRNPHNILQDTNNNISGHIVCIIPSVAF